MMIIAMKKFAEVSAVVAWDRESYIKEAQKQLKDDNGENRVNFKSL